MCSELKLLDAVRLQNKTAANFGVASSKDSQYFVLVEDGVYILKLCGMMDNFLKTLSCVKWFIKVGEFALSSHLGINLNSFITTLPKYDLYEAVLRLDLSEELNEASPLRQQPVQAQWSQLGLVANNNCALAVLSNTGSLSVYVYTINDVEFEEFIEICNTSKICLEYLSKKFFQTIFRGTTSTSMFVELKKRAEIATPTAFTWTHLFLNDSIRFSLLIIGHLDGGISICRISEINSNEISCKCDVIGYFQTDLKQPTFMHWQQANHDDGLLIIGNIEGKVKTISVCNVTYDHINFGDEQYLWEEIDNIKVEHIKVIIQDTNMFILTVKGSVLIITLINQSGTVLDVYPFYVGDILITGVEHYEKNIILILAYTGVLKEVMLLTENNKIKLKWRHLFIDFKWWSHRTHGLIISPNKVFIGVLVSMSKLTNIKKRKDHVRLLICMNVSKKPLEALLNNENNLLTLHWDCLEVLRLNGLIDRKLSNEGLSPELDYDKLSLVQLKMCFWLAKSSEMMQHNTSVLRNSCTIKLDNIRYILKIWLTMDHIQALLELLTSGNDLSKFHMQSLDILNMFLKETIASGIIPKLGLGKVTIDGLCDILAVTNELKYPEPVICLWCEEKIIGLSCVPMHPDSRCCISYMPITDLPYYRCQFCKCIVHSKLIEVYKPLLCPYCDISLSYVGKLVDKNALEDIGDLDNTIKINCNIDCLQEEEDLNEIEHAFTHIQATNELIDIIQISDDSDSEVKIG